MRPCPKLAPRRTQSGSEKSTPRSRSALNAQCSNRGEVVRTDPALVGRRRLGGFGIAPGSRRSLIETLEEELSINGEVDFSSPRFRSSCFAAYERVHRDRRFALQAKHFRRSQEAVHLRPAHGRVVTPTEVGHPSSRHLEETCRNYPAHSVVIGPLRAGGPIGANAVVLELSVDRFRAIAASQEHGATGGFSAGSSMRQRMNLVPMVVWSRRLPRALALRASPENPGLGCSAARGRHVSGLYAFSDAPSNIPKFSCLVIVHVPVGTLRVFARLGPHRFLKRHHEQNAVVGGQPGGEFEWCRKESIPDQGLHGKVRSNSIESFDQLHEGIPFVPTGRNQSPDDREPEIKVRDDHEVVAEAFFSMRRPFQWFTHRIGPGPAFVRHPLDHRSTQSCDEPFMQAVLPIRPAMWAPLRDIRFDESSVDAAVAKGIWMQRTTFRVHAGCDPFQQFDIHMDRRSRFLSIQQFLERRTDPRVAVRSFGFAESPFVPATWMEVFRGARNLGSPEIRHPEENRNDKRKRRWPTPSCASAHESHKPRDLGDRRDGIDFNEVVHCLSLNCSRAGLYFEPLVLEVRILNPLLSQTFLRVLPCLRRADARVSVELVAHQCVDQILTTLPSVPLTRRAFTSFQTNSHRWRGQNRATCFFLPLATLCGSST